MHCVYCTRKSHADKWMEKERQADMKDGLAHSLKYNVILPT